MLAAFVRLTWLLKRFAERILLTGFLAKGRILNPPFCGSLGYVGVT